MKFVYIIKKDVKTTPQKYSTKHRELQNIKFYSRIILSNWKKNKKKQKKKKRTLLLWNSFEGKKSCMKRMLMAVTRKNNVKYSVPGPSFGQFWLSNKLIIQWEYSGLPYGSCSYIRPFIGVSLMDAQRPQKHKHKYKHIHSQLYFKEGWSSKENGEILIYRYILDLYVLKYICVP